MSMADEPAFPEIKSESRNYADGNVTSIWSDGGLTKREYFAGLAMQGFATKGVPVKRGFTPEEIIAMAAVMAADALLAELEENK